MKLVSVLNDMGRFQSASTAINTTGCTDAVVWHRLQSGILGGQGNGAVFQHITWNANIADPLCLVEGRMGVSQIEEPLQVADVPTNVNHFIVGITNHLPLHVLTIRAGLHNKHLDHILINLNLRYKVSDNFSDSAEKG